MITKDHIQQEALAAWKANRCRGLVAAATGTGKSKIAILAAQEVYNLHRENTDIILAAPFRELLDVGWPEEFLKWGSDHILPYITFTTYASIHKLDKRKRSLVILDEGHHLTLRAALFFEDNVQDRILALSATPPKELPTNLFLEDKPPILRVAPLVYSYSLRQASEDGLVSDFRIWVVDCYLDATVKYVNAGPKDNQFKTTERANYDYIMKKLKKLQAEDKFGSLQAVYGSRMRMLYNLKSKFDIAKKILTKFKPTERTIIFCGSIAQAEAMAGKNVYHSKSGRTALADFKLEKINTLAVIKALDEGHNLPPIDNMIIIQASSKSLQTIQRLGRGIRFREGHRARVFLLQAIGTVDVRWVQSALEEIDPAKVKSFDSSKL